MSGNTKKRQPIDGLINVCTLAPLHFYIPEAFFICFALGGADYDIPT